MSKPTHLTEATFDQFVADNELVLIDFWADWCRPCKMVAPILDELAGEFESEGLHIGKVDTDAERNLAMKYGATSIPTFWAFKQGKPVGRFVGAYPKAQFIDIIKQMIELDMEKLEEEQEAQ